jgi:hypothetical protein
MGKTVTPILTGICLFLAVPALAAGKPKADDAFVIAIERFYCCDHSYFDRFTVAKDGSWEFKPPSGESKKGKLSANDLDKWVKEIEDGGLYTVKSGPHRGSAEGSMVITIQAKDKKTRVRIPLKANLSQAIERKIVELVQPGK